MTIYEIISITIAILALGISIGAIYFSYRSSRRNVYEQFIVGELADLVHKIHEYKIPPKELQEDNLEDFALQYMTYVTSIMNELNQRKPILDAIGCLQRFEELGKTYRQLEEAGRRSEDGKRINDVGDRFINLSTDLIRTIESEYMQLIANNSIKPTR